MFNTLVAPKRTMFPQPGIAEVVQAITSTQRGRVKFKASFWPARFYLNAQNDEQVLPLEQVSVVGVDGITLLVIPINSSVPAA